MKYTFLTKCLCFLWLHEALGFARTLESTGQNQCLTIKKTQDMCIHIPTFQFHRVNFVELEKLINIIRERNSIPKLMS